MSNRTIISSGAPWEKQVGYCRAVRVGNLVAVSGTAPVGDSGELVAPGDPYAQARRCIDVIAKALAEAGAGLDDVYRTRMFVTDIEHWPEIGRAHREAFGMTPPATTMVEVSRLITPGMLVEIEADAWLADETEVVPQ
jgi:isochorismate pyruvate lyase